MLRYYGRRKRTAPAPTAVALEYHRGEDRAPVVTASGRGQVAEQIIAIAREHGIFIQPDPDLVEILAHLDLGEAIPPELYFVLAEILAFVYRLNQEEQPRADPGA